ncbi:SLAM family member 5-like isoform X2 [Erinaceus europaeus]|uniref:SLAM family member 5-like isoform X2 n=1 Tax=Erinaceus europaeus TaxID=9365 RepID=A0ABM3Y9A6_ERIEU|nr:SLAM family member 5-like isoform X2 [Erinaceus europaeus]
MALLSRPHLCWVSWFLGSFSLLLSTCSTGAKNSGVPGAGLKDSKMWIPYTPLTGIQEGSVWFQVVLEQEAQLKEISWLFRAHSSYSLLLRIQPGAEDAPTWFSLQDKYRQRVHVPTITSLRIERLTREDSGQYRAQVLLSGGTTFEQVFLLTVYEPLMPPQILVVSPSITTDWCNVTLLCRVTGTTGDLNVTWESKGLPRELNPGGASGPAPHSWTLPVSLPQSQPNASVTCVVSNPVDQKMATKDLGQVCSLGSDGQETAVFSRVIPGIVVAALLVLGAGLLLWKKKGKKKKKEKMETGRDAGWQEDQEAPGDGIYYADLIPKEIKSQGNSERHLEEEQDVNTIYSEVQATGQATETI